MSMENLVGSQDYSNIDSEDSSADTITELNEEDLGSTTQDEAVQAFEEDDPAATDGESFVVEVLRKASLHACDNNNVVRKMKPKTRRMANIMEEMATKATQTDALPEGEVLPMLDPDFAAYEMLMRNEQGSLLEPSSRHGIALEPTVDLSLSDLELASGLDFYDQPLDIEYREVILERSSAEDKVGLTLCYDNHEDEFTDIYVSEIEPESIAAMNSDIREGDQILQINGVEVRSREDAIQLFSENRANISLLIVRAVYQVDDGFMEEERVDFEDFRLIDERHRADFTENYQAQGEECGSTGTGSSEKSRNDKDSGVGRTDESTKNEESSEQELDCTSVLPHLELEPEPQHHCSNDSFTSNGATTCEGLPHVIAEEQLLQECARFKEVLETRYNHMSSQGLQRIDSQSSIEREIDALNKEMEQIQIECQQIYEAHKKEPVAFNKKGECVGSSAGGETYRSPSRSVPRMGTRLDYIKQLNALQNEGCIDPVWVRHEQLSRLGSALPSPHPNSIILPLDSLGKDSTSPVPTAAVSCCHSSHTKGVSSFPNGGSCSGHIVSGVAALKERESVTSTTSAYNTGDSNRSTPLTLALTHTQNVKGEKKPLLSLSMFGKGQKFHHPSDADDKIALLSNGHDQHPSDIRENDIPIYAECYPPHLYNLQQPQENGEGSVSRTSQTPEPPKIENLQEVYSQYAEVMYTNQANLQHTMMVQQKLFQQKLIQQKAEKESVEDGNVKSMKGSPSKTSSNGHKSRESSPKHQPDSSCSSPRNTVPTSMNSSPRHLQQALQNSQITMAEGGAESSGANNSGVPMEWVVKRRADGTRYITRRPMRSKFLKERARKISEERSGMTTDDDAMSELKFGRYWSRDERKQHLEKAKEYKRRKQEMFRKKMETLKEIEEHKKEPNILELSHRKMMKHKSKKVFDDFTTVQEMLVHGSRGGGQSKQVAESSPKNSAANPLLSVTTV